MILVMALFFSMRLTASIPAFPSGGPTNDLMLDSWSFANTMYWTSDLGYYPLSYTNIAVSTNGPGNSLLIDTTGEAWLQYNVFETSGATNLNIESDGSLMFWFYPDWASASNTNMVGTGPGVWSRFIEVGTTNGAAGWWSLFTDANGNNLYFSAQDGLGNFTNYLVAPISFNSNSWHLIALTWTSTNTTLFVDGAFATNGPGLSVLPLAATLTNGFTVGSDLATGTLQMHGAMNDLTTYNYALETNYVDTVWTLSCIFYGASPDTLINFSAAPFYPAFVVGFYDVVSGNGYLQPVGTNTADCVITNSEVSIANVTSSPGTNGTVNLSFMVTGGNPGWPYDVFATAALANPKTNSTWVWMGQAYPCVTNTINGFTNRAAFLILGTPQSTGNTGLTDAYELLVLHVNPYTTDSMDDGLPDAWCVLNGLNVSGPSLGSEDPDHDALSNLEEYLYGTNPQISEGFNVWMANPTGSAGIP